MAFSAGCLADHGEPGLSAAADLRPVHPAGPGPGFAVRSAAPLSAAAAPTDWIAGWAVLPDRGLCRVPFSPRAGRGAAPGLCGPGGRGRSRAVFLRLLRIAAARMGLLGRHTGLLVTSVVFSVALGQKFLQKIGPPRKKSLLFCGKMLYNKKNRIWIFIPERRRQIWQRRQKNPRKSSASAAAC